MKGRSLSSQFLALGLGFLVQTALVRGQNAPQAAPASDPVVAVDRVMGELAAGDVLAIDVREEEAYAAGHLPRAVRLAPPTPACVAEGVSCVRGSFGRAGLTGGERLVLYGDDASGEVLAHLFWLLEWAGARGVRILDGGITAWREGGGAVERKDARLPAREFAAPLGERVADAGWVRDHFGLGGIEVLDLRDSGIWMENGYEAPEHWSAGHIPHSLPYDFRLWLPRSGRWPPVWRLRSALGELGPRPSTFVNLSAEFVLYGQGPEAPGLGSAYLSLRRLGIPVRVFPGGFAAWSRVAANPVVRIVGAREVRELLERENPSLAVDRPSRSLGILDLREDWDFRRGHIPGSFNLPAYSGFIQSLEELVRERWPATPRSELPLILYCYGRECIRSRDGATHAARLGFTKLLWFRDGLEAWTAAGSPLITPPSTAPSPASSL